MSSYFHCSTQSWPIMGWLHSFRQMHRNINEFNLLDPTECCTSQIQTSYCMFKSVCYVPLCSLLAGSKRYFLHTVTWYRTEDTLISTNSQSDSNFESKSAKSSSCQAGSFSSLWATVSLTSRWMRWGSSTWIRGSREYSKTCKRT